MNLYFLLNNKYLYYNFCLFYSFFIINYIMDQNIIKLNSLNKYVKNNFYFLNIKYFKNIFKFEIYYLDYNLIYISLKNLNKTSWDDDIILRIYSLNNKNFEDISIGGSIYDFKEIEIYTDIKLDYYKETNNHIIPKKIIQFKKNNFNPEKIYDFYYFLYKNNFYSYQNLSFNMLKINFINKYKEYMNDIESIYDNESKSLIYILFYLNLNGGIYISEYINNINSIDELRIDENSYLIKDNYVYLLFAKNNFINPKNLIDTIKKKEKIDFTKLLTNFKTINNKSFQIKDIKKKSEFIYYTNIYITDKYIFKIYSEKNNVYKINHLNNDYYILTFIDSTNINKNDNLDNKIYKKNNLDEDNKISKKEILKKNKKTSKKDNLDENNKTSEKDNLDENNKTSEKDNLYENNKTSEKDNLYENTRENIDENEVIFEENQIIQSEDIYESHILLDKNINKSNNNLKDEIRFYKEDISENILKQDIKTCKIENNIVIDIYNIKLDKEIKFNENNIKYKTEYNYIFKI